MNDSHGGPGAEGRRHILSSAKRLAERCLVGAGLPFALRMWHRHRTVILAYHNIVPDDDPASGDVSLHMARARFAAQLDRLGETHEVVALDQLLRGSAQTRAGRPRAVVTFDDAYRGTLELGLPELSRRGMPATVFVAPGLLGDRTFWWDRLADPATGEVRPARRDRALEDCRGEQEEILATLEGGEAPAAEMPPHSRSATEGELEAAAREHDVLLGSHTWSHPNLTRLGEAEVLEELGRSREWLEERFPCAVPWIAYPYGLTSSRVAELSRQVYEGGLALTGRLVPAAAEVDRFRVPRINIPSGLSLSAFELWTSGMGRV